MTYGDMRDSLSDDLYLSHHDVEARYASDWSEAPAHLPEVVLRPRTIDDLSSMLSLAQQSGQRLVTQGGAQALLAVPHPNNQNGRSQQSV